ncbi:conserved phage C-terminal domain-containing protein [Salmonella enterica subsp. enterica serovar Pomona]|uniref:conserved phage C-terminal domain-containing protein n=1 Tax=Salmonella enterica TaxID=28901 RepID=UPI001285A928|nr:conserved phage C-terminal domain-containing protein [Salmonella enterica]EBR8237556.1 GntR family transcriptional regulator [Salmonella enterica subsp. enterica serovar Heidelberg]EBV5481948.1 GntR family transcriptional regulator [Salmonella enterica subsp. enterica serovar Pomona]EDE6889088.1 GntR family transcriptional regulator [Salmonella enterica subsp. enterica serovar Bareilly]EAM7717698.1 GntR family transcriptional regulator [Salmonella enterica]EAO2691062.1 GntR family transcrip
MSTKLTGYVWDACAASGMKLSSVAIMARLADFSNDEGICWPSIETISRQLGAGVSTVRTAIAKLEADGWLSRKARRQGNRNASNVYQLNVAKLQAAAFAHLSDPDQSKSDPSESDASKSDPSKSDPSKSDPSKSGKNGGFDPSESGGDPSVKSKQDPQVISKPSCPVASQPDPEVVITDQAILVLTHLNQISGSRYQKSKTSLENIRARLREGYSVADLQLVIDLKHEHWHENDEQYQYMRPETLFGPKKFESYLQSATRWDQKGRPKRADWGAKKRDVMAFGPVDTTIPAGFRG